MLPGWIFRLRLQLIHSRAQLVADHTPVNGLQRACRQLCSLPAKKPYYITTPIFYPNSVPHVGHLYSLVTADIIARYQRLANPSTTVHFLAGTDEHGFKIQQAAQAQKLSPQELCDSVSLRFKELARQANVSNTCFVRTSEQRHHTAVEHVWRELLAKGLIYQGSYSGWYSISDECFYTSSQITRLPPSKPGEPEITISTETGSSVSWHEEQNYMFRLSSFRDYLLSYYSTHPGAIYPKQYHDYVLDILKSGPLDDLSISRPRERLGWGVRVPGDDAHTIYVWFDALLVYLSGIGYPWGCGGQSGWPVDLQIIGKDIIRFHAIYFPAILHALRLPLPNKLLTHAHWTANQKKMSKSIGNVADPFEAMDRFGVDVVRYYLARVGGHFKDDVGWSHEQLQKHSDEIQSYLGNFYLRITSKKMASLVSSAHWRPPLEIFESCLLDDESPRSWKDLISKQASLMDDVQQCLDQLRLADALNLVVELLRKANAMLTIVAPWSKDNLTAQTSYAVSYETLRVSGVCLQPFMPEVAEKLLDALRVPPHARKWNSATLEEGYELADIRDVSAGARFF